METTQAKKHTYTLTIDLVSTATVTVEVTAEKLREIMSMEVEELFQEIPESEWDVQFGGYEIDSLDFDQLD